jgi:hypothetical protein
MVIAATMGYAYELTGDVYYLEVGYQLLEEGMKVAPELLPVTEVPVSRRGYHAGATRSDGKWFSFINFYTNRFPTAFRDLDEAGLTRIREARPDHRRGPHA